MVGDHILDVGQLEAVGLQDLQPLLHQHVVVGDVAGGQPQFLDTGLFRHVDPDFGDERSPSRSEQTMCIFTLLSRLLMQARRLKAHAGL